MLFCAAGRRAPHGALIHAPGVLSGLAACRTQAIEKAWVPAFAGMSGREAGYGSPNTTTLALTFSVGQMGEVMPVATATFCRPPEPW